MLSASDAHQFGDLRLPKGNGPHPVVMNIHGGFWDFMANFDINRAGFAVAGLFVVVWAVAIAYWKLGGLDQRWTPTASDQVPDTESTPG